MCVYVFYTQKTNKPNPIKLLFTSVWPSIDFFFFLCSSSVVSSGSLQKKKFPSSLSRGYYCFYNKTSYNNRKSFPLVCGHKGHPLPRDVPYFLTSFHGKSVCSVFFNRGLYCKGLEVLMGELRFYQ